MSLTFPGQQRRHQTDLDADCLEELWMTERQFYHFFDLCQLLATTADVIIAHFIQCLFLFLNISITHSTRQYYTYYNNSLHTQYYIIQFCHIFSSIFLDTFCKLFFLLYKNMQTACKKKNYMTSKPLN